MSEKLVPIEIGESRFYVAAEEGPRPPGGEAEIAGRRAGLDETLAGLRAFAEQTVDSLRDTEASRVTVEFGCEFVLETGSLVAVVGKASGKSAVKVTLEWSKPHL